LIPAAVFS